MTICSTTEPLLALGNGTHDTTTNNNKARCHESFGTEAFYLHWFIAGQRPSMLAVSVDGICFAVVFLVYPVFPIVLFIGDGSKQTEVLSEKNCST